MFTPKNMFAKNERHDEEASESNMNLNQGTLNSAVEWGVSEQFYIGSGIVNENEIIASGNFQSGSKRQSDGSIDGTAAAPSNSEMAQLHTREGSVDRQRLNHLPEGEEHLRQYSTKVFIGGLPFDMHMNSIVKVFSRYGPLVLDWPYRDYKGSNYPPKGYAFLLYYNESSVKKLVRACYSSSKKLYYRVSSVCCRNKPVEIRPWSLADSEYNPKPHMEIDSRKTVFVGGVPRTMKAYDLAIFMENMYGAVSFASINSDIVHKYPNGASRICFENLQSYIAAISGRFVHLRSNGFNKCIEIKPFVLDDQMCDECNCESAPYFCADVACLQYYCNGCCTAIHAHEDRQYHKVLVKTFADRSYVKSPQWYENNFTKYTWDNQ